MNIANLFYITSRDNALTNFGYDETDDDLASIDKLMAQFSRKEILTKGDQSLEDTYQHLEAPGPKQSNLDNGTNSKQGTQGMHTSTILTTLSNSLTYHR